MSTAVRTRVQRRIIDVGEKLGSPDPTGGWDQRVSNGHGGHLYYLDGLLHREDGPAAVWMDGTELYYLNGVLQRAEDAGPAPEQPRP